MPGLFGAVPEKPCGECAQCPRITRGIHADIRVINPQSPTRSDKDGNKDNQEKVGDEARHQRIRFEHIADLQNDAWLKPFEGDSRVFILDGAELMSLQASNMSLKTLEEPPPNVIIIFVATAASALPATIRGGPVCLNS